ncbi:hypothetical protein [Sphingobium bisphenolivorans]|uniref:hypothetical protein n=1 Tax=Sphingobium bisphenolivorans TaxID=1335760 RepID=UPI001EE6CE5B|nr:hypothetical protein [Sphingobium bisphenolivorans]
MIEAKGQAVTLTRQASGAYDPATGSASVTTTTQAGKVVILPFGAGLRKLAGENISQADRQCTLSALNNAGAALTPPEVNDTLTDASGNVWTIIESSPLAPAGLDILYELTIRGSE